MEKKNRADFLIWDFESWNKIIAVTGLSTAAMGIDTPKTNTTKASTATLIKKVLSRPWSESGSGSFVHVRFIKQTSRPKRIIGTTTTTGVLREISSLRYYLPGEMETEPRAKHVQRSNRRTIIERCSLGECMQKKSSRFSLSGILSCLEKR